MRPPGGPSGPPPWRDAEWQAGARAWIEREMERLGAHRTGPIEQPHVYPWATVMRIPTDVGPLWFKANEEALRHEAALIELLAERHPDCVPPLLATHPDERWMLMSDAGRSLREVVPEEYSQDRWLDVLPRYAAVQLDLEDAVDQLFAVGLPDLRLATLADRYADLFDRFPSVDTDHRYRAAEPLVAELADQLASYGIAETVQHDDLHDGQVFVRDGRLSVLDWGDACVSHPFFTLSVTLEGGVAWGLDDVEGSVDLAPFVEAYLTPYADRYGARLSLGDLRDACAVALRLGWACRAANGHVPGEDHYTHRRLEMFLDRRVSDSPGG